MNTTGFNLKNYLEKKAFYEAAQGYIHGQTRAWQNCVRKKLNAGVGANDAWESCLEDFNKLGNKSDWIADNVHEDSIKVNAQCDGAQLQMGEYWKRIKQYKSKGMTTAQAVMKALDDAKDDAGKIPEK